MNRLALAVCGLLAVSIASDASAGSKDPNVEIRPFVGLRLGGNVNDSSYDSDDERGRLIDDLNVKPGSQFGLMVSVPVSLMGVRDPNNNVMVEAFVAFQPSTLRIDDRPELDLSEFEGFHRDGDYIELFDLDVTYIHLGALYQWTNYSWTPYVNFSLGATNFAPDGDLDSRTEFSLGLGGGVKKYFNDRFGIRSQVRGFGTFLGGREEVYCDRYGCWSYEESITFSQFEFSTGLVIAL